MITYNQTTQEKNERIDRLSNAVGETQVKLDDTEIRFGGVQLELAKIKDQYNTSQTDLQDTTNKL